MNDKFFAKKIFLFCHQAIDDYMSCNGLIRLFSEQYEEIIIPVKESNFEFVKLMVGDLKNVNVISIIDDNNGFNIYLDSYKNSYRFIGLGFWGKNPAEFDPSSPEDSFYEQLGVDPQLRFDKFYVSEDFLNKMGEENLEKIKKFTNHQVKDVNF